VRGKRTVRGIAEQLKIQGGVFTQDRKAGGIIDFGLSCINRLTNVRRGGK